MPRLDERKAIQKNKPWAILSFLKLPGLCLTLPLKTISNLKDAFHGLNI
ncbi:hypothetical protein [Acetobacterium sp.]